MNAQVGVRVHRVIGSLVDGPIPSPLEVVAATRQWWTHDPCGGTTAASARLRCATCVSVYFQRCVPDRKMWASTGVEVRAGRAVADLVWTHTDGRVVFDELKSGAPDPETDAELADQLMRLVEGGTELYGDKFAGVRLVPLEAPAKTRMFTTRAGALVPVRTTAGMRAR